MNAKKTLEDAAEVLKSHPSLTNEPRWREVLIMDLLQLARALS